MRIPGAPTLALQVLLALAASAGASWAQAASIQGEVADSVAGAPLAGARVQALGPDGSLIREILSDGAGRFALDVPAAGQYTLAVERLGYEPRRLEVSAGPRAPPLTVRLVPLPATLDPVVVSVSRAPENALDAPAAVSVVDSTQIEESVSFTPLDEIRATPGMDFASKGLIQHTFAVRGGRGANSAALLMLADHRYARLPSIGFNVPYLVPSLAEDLERIEVTRGPGAALYGPNSYQGVVHLISRSPFESAGTTVSVAGGERSVAQGAGRTAGRLSERLAFKISGQYFRGDDWQFTDPDESTNRDSAIARGADPDTLRIGKREPVLEQAAGEARLDWRPDEITEAVATVGMADAIQVVDITPDVGAVQVIDWRYWFAQARVTRGRLFANAMLDLSDSGDSYQLRNGAPLVDRSRVAAFQLQHGTVLGARHRLLYGADLQLTDPRTEGTINGRNEDDDRLIETGAYLEETAVLDERLDLVAALRADYHDRLADLVVSPRAGLVFRPVPSQALRFTYNGAFNSPDASDLFVDIVAGSFDPLPFDIRRAGTPLDGFELDRSCGGLCMRSPFTPAEAGGPTAGLPADATLLWPAVVAVLGQQQVDISGVPPPTPDQVGTDLIAFDPASLDFVPVTPADLEPLDAPRRTITNAFELGYKGVIGERVMIEADVYRNHLTDLLGPLFAATPNVFLDQESLAEYLEASGVSSDSAPAIAEAAAMIPLGTVTSAEAGSPDVLVFRRQGGEVTFWGADLALSADLTPAFSVSANFAWLSDDSIPGVAGVGDFVPGVPTRKGAVGLAYRNSDLGLTARIVGQAVASFPVESGVYVGRVDGYQVLDLYAGWRLPWAPELELSLDVQNLLDDRHSEYVGAPEIGRLVVGRLRATL